MIVQYTEAHVYQPDGTYASTFFVQDDKVVSPCVPDQICSLSGKYVFPTFEDAHNHPSGMCRANYHLNLESVNSREALASQLVTPLSQNKFIVGVRWNENQYGSLTRDFLDSISTQIPIVIVEQSYHRAVLNSAAQDYFQVPENFPGNLNNGILEEQAWIEWAWPRLETDVPLFQESLLDFQQLLLSQGIGAVHDLFIGTLPHLQVYQNLLQHHQWKLALAGYLSPHLLPEVRAKDFSFLQGIKLFLDGSFGAYTACLKKPYLKRPRHHGHLWWSLEELEHRIQLGVHQGFRKIALHVIGDRAFAQAVELIRRTKQTYSETLEFRIEHASLLDPKQLDQLVAWGVTFCLQPNFISGDSAFSDRLGERVKELLPLHAYLRAGAKFGFGSDHLPTDPWYGIRATVQAPLTQQQLSFTQAIHHYTSGSASLINKESVRGQLTPGYEANFWITSQNPLKHSVLPEQVFLQGKPVFFRDGY